ncbi:MAG: LAGLIDADG family homing endonuclease [Candidatus Aenigmatarchaeota archaeon]
MKTESLTVEKAELIGLLCADGTHYHYISIYNRFYPKRGKYYTTISPKEQIEFGNLNIKLLKHFQKLLKIAYNYHPKITGTPKSLKIHISKKNIIKDLLQYTDFGSEKWKVPKEIKEGPFDVKAAFIRGVYEGDGVKLQTSKYGKPYLFFEMKNKPSLEDLKKLLQDIGINARINKNSNGMTRLIVYGFENITKFKKFIKPKYKKLG